MIMIFGNYDIVSMLLRIELRCDIDSSLYRLVSCGNR